MNLTEQVNRGKIKQTGQNRRPGIFGSKPFVGLPTRTVPRSRKCSTPSSKISWGKSHHSVSNSSFLHSDTSGSREDAKIILALSEGRGEARCEVGIAAINVSHPHLILCQISDTQSYDNTLRKINIFNPTQILVPMTFVESAKESRLIEKVKEHFPDVTCTAVKRNTYNKASGMDFIQELCVPSLNSVLLVVQYRYYALTAVSALLKFLQSNLYIFYASGSIVIDYQESEGYAVIDVSTADRLELVSSTKPLQATKYSTLFGVLNNCYTKIGERALRTILLQPPYNTSIILERQECVTTLIRNPERLQAVQVVLQKMGNIDQLLTLPTIVIDDSEYCSNRQLNYMLFLNGLVDLVPTFNDIIADFEAPFFRNLHNTLKSQEFTSIKDTVRTLIHDNAYAAKSNTGLMQRCFAIKPGINGLLDLVRKIYSERLDEMRDYVKALGEKYDLPLTLGNNVTKGYHIVFSLNKHQKISMKKSDIPGEFLQVCRLAGSFTMKTMELINYQSRIDDIVTDILKISNVMIFKTLTSFKKHMGLFFKLCEDIANIDVMQSLAEVSMRNNYVRPTFSDYTKVHDSQHPMLDMLAHEKPVANLISSSEDFNVHIITGPNGSGKSIFIRQVMLIQIMAQIGGYVPASSAVFRPADRLFARIYLEDNMECGASSFILEIKEIIYILSHVTNNSLIIMDELARSTSLEEGSALAMALCEYLADSKAFIYLTSHFTLVTKLGDLYLNVKNWHLDTYASGDTPRSLKLDFRYSLKPGVTNLKRYGFFMVKNIWPKDILEDIYKIYERCKRPELEVRTQGISPEIRLKYTIESKLRRLKSKGKLTLSNINKYIQDYRKNLESLGIYLENINFGENRQFQQRISNEDIRPINYNTSFDEIEDSFRMDVENFENSSYKNLANFIDENSGNLELLNPEINISFTGSQRIFDDCEEVDCSLMEAIKLHEEKLLDMELGVHENQIEPRKINILGNVLLNQVSYSETSREVRDILRNAQNINENIERNEVETSIIEGHSEFDEINDLNRSLITEMQQLRDNLAENRILNPIFDDQDRVMSPDLFPSPPQTESETLEFQDFQFLKPMDRPLKKRMLKLSLNENQIDSGQQKFSLPLLQNQDRTSTPLIQSNVAEDRFVNSSFFDYKKEISVDEQCFRDNEIGQEIRKEVTEKRQHLFPEVIVMEGPNDLSQSFGEEDEPRKKFPLKVSDDLKKQHSNDEDLEKFVINEVKLLLSNSVDLFDGDVDTLEITVDNIQKNKLEINRYVCPNREVYGIKSAKIDDENEIKMNPQFSRLNDQFNLEDSRSGMNGVTGYRHQDELENKPNLKKINQKLFEDDPNYIENFLENNLIIPGNYENKVEPTESKTDTREKSTNVTSVFEASRRRNLDELDNSSSHSCNNQEEYTSISDVSKWRNLDNPDSKSSNDQRSHDSQEKLGSGTSVSPGFHFGNPPSNSGNNKEASTSISSASKKRNLDNPDFKTSDDPGSSDSKEKLKGPTNFSSGFKFGNSLSNSGTNQEASTSISSASKRRNLDKPDSKTSDDQTISDSKVNLILPINVSTGFKFGNSSSNSGKNQKASTNIWGNCKTRNLDNLNSKTLDDPKSSDFKEKLEGPITVSSVFNFGNSPSNSGNNHESSGNKSRASRKRNFDDPESKISDDKRASDLEQRNPSVPSGNKLRNNSPNASISQSQESNYNDEEMSFSKCRTKTLSLSPQIDENSSELIRKQNSDSENDENTSGDTFELGSRPKLYKKTLGYTRRTKVNVENKMKRRKSSFGHLHLTRQEIQYEFAKQDEILLDENADIEACNKYLKQRMNRPSVKQLEKVEHIVTIRRTEHGPLVVPPEPSPSKPRRNPKRPLLESSNVFDMSIFSDRNANKMSAFLASNETNYNRFKFDEKQYETSSSQHSSNISQYVQKRQRIEYSNTQSFGMVQKPSSFHIQRSDTSQSSGFLPAGFFKENKKDIDNICAKYLFER